MPLSTQEHEWLKTLRSAYFDEELQFFMSLHSRETEKSYGNYELKFANLNLLSFPRIRVEPRLVWMVGHVNPGFYHTGAAAFVLQA